MKFFDEGQNLECANNSNVAEFPNKRAAFNFLIVDETSAVKGYDDVLARTDLTEEERVKLERIRNAEIDHIKDLSELYQKLSTANIVGTDSIDDKKFGDGKAKEAAQEEMLGYINECEALNDKIEKLVDAELGASDNNQISRLRSDRRSLESKRDALLKKIKDLRRQGVGNVSGNSKYDSSNFADADRNVKWQMHQAKSGYYYFADPNGNTYKENGVEVRFGSNVKPAAGEFFIKKLFNKNLWGWEVPRVVVD